MIFRIRSEGEKLRDIFAQQLREGLVQIGTYRDIALIAGVFLREFADHARLFVKTVTFKLHRAGLKRPVAGDYQPPETRLAGGSAASGKILDGRFQGRFVVGNPIGFIHALFDSVQTFFQDGQLFLCVQEVVPASRAPG